MVYVVGLQSCLSQTVTTTTMQKAVYAKKLYARDSIYVNGTWYSSFPNINIYNSNGTLLANRTVTGNNFNLIWSGVNNFLGTSTTSSKLKVSNGSSDNYAGITNGKITLQVTKALGTTVDWGSMVLDTTGTYFGRTNLYLTSNISGTNVDSNLLRNGLTGLVTTSPKLSITTTGTTGAATHNTTTNVLNIPNKPDYTFTDGSGFDFTNTSGNITLKTTLNVKGIPFIGTSSVLSDDYTRFNYDVSTHGVTFGASGPNRGRITFYGETNSANPDAADGIYGMPNAVASVGNQVIVSPPIFLNASGWKTTSGGSYNSVGTRFYVRPVTGVSNPKGILNFDFQTGGIYTNNIFGLSNYGEILLNDNAGTSGQVLTSGGADASATWSTPSTPAFTYVQRGYKVYSALITQSDTSAPTAVVLQNDLGGSVTFTYVGGGFYRGGFTGIFPDLNKVWTCVQSTNNSGAGGSWQSVQVNPDNTNEFIIIVAGGDDLGYNDFLYKTPIEIRVYN